MILRICSTGLKTGDRLQGFNKQAGGGYAGTTLQTLWRDLQDLKNSFLLPHNIRKCLLLLLCLYGFFLWQGFSTFFFNALIHLLFFKHFSLTFHPLLCS